MLKKYTLFIFSLSKAEYYKIIWRYIQLLTAGYLLNDFIMCFNYELLGIPILYSQLKLKTDVVPVLFLHV